MRTFIHIYIIIGLISTAFSYKSQSDAIAAGIPDMPDKISLWSLLFSFVLWPVDLAILLYLIATDDGDDGPDGFTG